jgi:polar amino acid transport system substrate-binding protein
MEKIISKYRGAPAQFLKPGAWISSSRQGMDRPKDWQAPSI